MKYVKNFFLLLFLSLSFLFLSCAASGDDQNNINNIINRTINNAVEDMGLYASNQRILNYINRLAPREHSSDKDKFEGQIPLSDLSQKMLLVKKKFKHDQPQYNSQNRHIENLFQTWYVENTEEFLGYNVLQLGKQAVLWHSFHDQEYEIIVIKNMEQQFFCIIAVPYNSMPSTDRMNRKNLLQSPLGLPMVEYLIKGADTATLRTPGQLIENRKSLLKAELQRNRSPLQAGCILETLCKRTPSELYRYLANAPALAEIDNMSDYSNVRRPPVLERDMTVGIFTALVTLIASMLPDPTATKVLAATNSGCQLLAGSLATNYPNEVIIGLATPIPGMCTPFTITSQ